MRFCNYLKEDISMENWDEIRTILNRDCKPYIKELRGASTLLMRGISGSVSGNYEKKNIRKDRKPRVIDVDLSDRLSKYTKRKFGWDTRKAGLFTSKNVDDARSWGKPVIIFPINKFAYVWSNDVDRLYGMYDTYDFEPNKDLIWDKVIRIEIDKFTNKNLNKYLSVHNNSKSECIITGTYYYQIGYEWYNTLLKYYSTSMDKKQ